ncbi:uncharacterized protein LOC122258594 [Penaeus japonicus]|uniref:uncharacterized protein LOC122258594 n=1 Tax=Penaeus japonicus TaxID=27405 RepID=UPI001C70C077|nr:uncharacterized protein LOC122258594 [Penaeus japonicus]
MKCQIPFTLVIIIATTVFAHENKMAGFEYGSESSRSSMGKSADSKPYLTPLSLALITVSATLAVAVLFTVSDNTGDDIIDFRRSDDRFLNSARQVFSAIFGSY